MPHLDAATTPDLAPAYDYVIIGGGSGGAVMARRLAEDKAARILLIEAGPNDAGIAEIADPASWVGLGGGRYDYGYVYAPAPGAYGRRIPIPRGKVLGGSSSLNAMMWYRGHPADYDGWAAEGATGWDFKSILPYFKRSEDWQGGESAWRGAGGPLRIELPQDPHPLTTALLPAAAELGLPVIEDCNAASNEGACRANFNISAGQRWSVARGYLHPARDWPNLTILTGSTVLRLVVENGRCTGVVHLVGGQVRTSHARVETILAAGSIDSPRLLMLSGIGKADDLRRLGLPVVADLPGVGANLQDHPLLMGINFVPRHPAGPLRHQGGGTMINWKSSADQPIPDLHAFTVQRPHMVPELAGEYDVPEGSFAISPGLMRSQSRGYLRLLGAAADSPLEIQPNYLAERRDVEALVNAVELIQDLADTAAYRPLIARPAAPNRRLSRAEREHFVRLSLSTFFHPSGTCKMGQDAESVVDPQLRVRGVEALRIVDASIIPTIPTCNTNAPVVMIAERAADLVRGVHRAVDHIVTGTT